MVRRDKRQFRPAAIQVVYLFFMQTLFSKGPTKITRQRCRNVGISTQNFRTLCLGLMLRTLAVQRCFRSLVVPPR